MLSIYFSGYSTVANNVYVADLLFCKYEIYTKRYKKARINVERIIRLSLFQPAMEFTKATHLDSEGMRLELIY